MSSAATVPIIGPDGATYDIPHDQVSNAVAKGGKLAMDIVGPDNNTYAVPLDNVYAALSNGGTLKPPAMPAAPIPQGLQPTPTLEQAANIQDPAQRYAAIRQRMLEDAAPVAQSAQAAVPVMPVSQAVAALPDTGTLLRRAKEAGKVFEALEQQIGDHMVDASAPGDVGLTRGPDAQGDEGFH